MLLGLLAVVPAIADTGDTTAPRHSASAAQQQTPAPAVQKARSITQINVTAAQAARAARHEYGGKVLGVQLEANTKAPYYRVRLISSGRVHVVSVNAHK